MKIPVVLLAAGESSRMFPLSWRKHKTHLFLLGKSILQHTIESFIKKGYKEIILVSSPSFDLTNVLDEDIKERIQIVYQHKPLGVGHAISLLKDYVKDTFLLANAYHYFTPYMKQVIEKASHNETLFIKETDNPQQYGIVKIKEDRIAEIIEKPTEWKGRAYRLIGFYILSYDFISSYLVKENLDRHHYSFENALNKMAKEKGLGFMFYAHETPTLKYPWHYLTYFRYLISNIYTKNKTYLYGGNVSENAIIDTSNGPVVVDSGEVKEFSIIRGPAYIGKKSVIGNNVLIRESDIEENSLIGYNSEIARSILQSNSKLHASYIGDSVIDKNFHSGYGFVTANKRLDNKPIKIALNKERVEIPYDRFGIVAGENVNIGSHSTTMPGTIIMPNTIIYPNIRVRGNVEGVVDGDNF